MIEKVDIPLATAGQENISTIKMIKTIYILNFISIVLPFCSLLAVVFAYVFENDARGYLKSHFRYLIRSFWIGALYYAVAAILCFVLIGFVLIFFWYVWWIIRNAKGFKDYLNQRDITAVTHWLF